MLQAINPDQDPVPLLLQVDLLLPSQQLFTLRAELYFIKKIHFICKNSSTEGASLKCVSPLDVCSPCCWTPLSASPRRPPSPSDLPADTSPLPSLSPLLWRPPAAHSSPALRRCHLDYTRHTDSGWSPVSVAPKGDTNRLSNHLDHVADLLQSPLGDIVPFRQLPLITTGMGRMQHKGGALTRLTRATLRSPVPEI